MMAYETRIRVGVFVGSFLLFVFIDAIAPRRARNVQRWKCWVANWSLLIDSFVIRAIALTLPLLAVGAAFDAQSTGWGIFKQVALPAWAEFAVAVLMIDFSVWAQHLISHKGPHLSRLPRVLKENRYMDVTAAIRFFPVTIAAPLVMKIRLAYLIWPAVWAAVAFVAMLNGKELFNQANLRLPLGFERAVRLALVTPGMRPVQHSAIRSKHDNNYGHALTLLDRRLDFPVRQSKAGHQAMVAGLEWQDEVPARLGWSLSSLFRRR